VNDLNIHNAGTLIDSGENVVDKRKTTFNALMTKEIEQNLMIASCKTLLEKSLITNEQFLTLKTKILKS
jgi:hypothetical protein